MSRSGVPDGGEPGPLVWVMSPRMAVSRAVAELARRLLAEWPGLRVVVASAGGAAAPGATLPGSVIRMPPPRDTPREVERALAHWRPRAIVLTEGVLPAALIRAAGAHGIGLVMADAQGAPGPVTGWRVWPGFTAGLLQKFDHILVRDAETMRAYRRAGAPTARVEAVGLMAEVPDLRAHPEADRDTLATRLNARPVWLAAAVPPAEEAAVIAAHRAAQRRAHRLLLVLVPREAARGPTIVDTVAARMRVAVRSRGEAPREDDQVYVADTEGELGLWYRLATTTYLGGTLAGPGTALDPLEPAALGSAVVHGPHLGPWQEAFERLHHADAACSVANTGALAEAVRALLSPERAAMMAHNAWETLTKGSEATERVVALTLEAVSAHGAR